MTLHPNAPEVPATTNTQFGTGPLVLFGLLAACAAVTLVTSGEVADTAGFIGVFLGSLACGIVFVRNARKLTGRDKLAWTFIGAGMLVAAGGVFEVAAIYAIHGDAPVFGQQDILFFGTYALMILGVSTLPHTQGSHHQRSRMVLDGVIGAVSFGTLLWVLIISQLTTDFATLAPMARFIGTVYPFFDLLVLTVAIMVLLRRSAYRFDPRLAMFTFGLVFQVLGDVSFLISARAGSFEQANPLYVVNLAGIAAFFATAVMLRASPMTREYAERNPPLWTIVTPYLPAVGMLGVFVYDTYWVSIDGVNGVLLAAMLIVGVLVIIRQGVAILENNTYVERQRNDLVATISHELRTPLTAIVGFLDILVESDDEIPAEQRSMIEIVQGQSTYMSRIVSDLIMLAGGSGGDMQLEVEAVPMHDLVEASIHASGVSARSVAVECPDDLTGFVDPARIQQVLVNLLTNAARYGGLNRLIRIEADGSDLAIEVHDDGEGVPRRFEMRVWDRFERGPNRLNATVPGSGIGLAIVEAIASAHGGSVAYRQSEEQGGACFAVYLPGRGLVRGEHLRDDSVVRVLPVRPVA